MRTKIAALFAVLALAASLATAQVTTNPGVTGVPAPQSAVAITGGTITGVTMSGSTITNNVTGALTGNADTATALATNPTDCGSNTFANAIAANGNLTCTSVPNAATTATAINTISTIVARDASGGTSLGFSDIGYVWSATGTTASVANGALTAVITPAAYNHGFVALRGVDNTSAYVACYYYVHGANAVLITNFITGSGTLTCTTDGNNKLNVTNNTGITTSFYWVHLRLRNLFP